MSLAEVAEERKKLTEDALRIVDDARAIEEAGAVGLEIEAMPHEAGKAVDEAVSIFALSSGAGIRVRRVLEASLEAERGGTAR